MSEPGPKVEKDVDGVGTPPVVIHHGRETAPKVSVDKFREMHEKEGLDFPVDADESRRRGGTTVEIQEHTD
jgi:hypothetical protein